MAEPNCTNDATSRYTLNQIYFYLTQGCNLRCRHCWIAPKYQGGSQVYPYLELDLFKSILEQAKPLGLQGVKLTGGEPLIHPHITEIIAILQTEQLSLGMETNGVACTQEIAAKLAGCKDSFVSVSLDGADAQTHEWVRGVQGCFDATLTGIRHLVDAGLRPQIIMSIMKRNKHQVESVVRLAELLGAGSVKFNLVQPVARGEHLHESDETLPLQELLELGRYVEMELRSSTELALYFSHPDAFRPLGRIFGNKGNGCSVCGILGILGVLGDGSYALCGIGETVPELVFGHASRDRLETVWKDHPVLQAIREGLPKRLHGICEDCIMKFLCMGHCIAQKCYRNKDLWAPFWFCEEADKLGLFPKSRTFRPPSR
ncbi:MAG: SynChlorMet cassette radical SAM/SPASM protein ScmF [Desulfomonilaceae bacterium]